MNTLKKVEAQVIAIYDPVTKTSKTDNTKSFTTQNVLIEFDQDQEYPSRMVLQFSGKAIENAIPTLTLNSYYAFSLNFKANEWTNPETGKATAFGTINCWKAAPLGQAGSSAGAPATDDDLLPF